MSITTYSELQTTVANWLHRDDLTSQIPDFITLAEAKLKRELRTRDMEKRATTDTSTEYTELPSDFVAIRSAYLNTDPKQQLRLMTPADIRSRWIGSTTGQPEVFAIVGNEIMLAPSPDGTYEIELDYYAFSALSETNQTNWLLTKYPDVYLYGALVEATMNTKNDKRLGDWVQLLRYAVDSVKDSDWDSSLSAPLRIVAG
jgi:hypothetical protein